MKNRILSLMLLLAVVLSFTNCKKKETTEDIVEPVVVTNPPPAGGDYWIINKSNTHIYWTQDFVTFNELSTSLIGTPYMFGDTLVCVSNTSNAATISYGSIFNLSNFKTISSSKTFPSIGFIDGHFVAQTIDGNNYYLGYCNAKNGESNFSYTLQQNGVYFEHFYRIRNVLMTKIHTSIGSNMAYSYFSNDSLKWMATAVPISGCNYYDGGNNLLVGYYYGQLATTSDINLNSATWSSITNLNYTNTSDSIGTFNFNNFVSSPTNNSGLYIVNNKWKVFGYVNVSSNDHNLPAVNTSTDQGATWQTTLLTGIPSDIPPHSNINYRCLVSKTSTFIASNNDVFKSTDGVNFTKVMTGADAQIFMENSNTSIYMK